MSQVLSDLLARRGYAQLAADEALRLAWIAAAGPDLAAQSTLLGLRRGTLEVLVSHSAWIQELAFQQPELIRRLNELGHSVRSVRGRTGRLPGSPRR
jgi:predicted nucleic acid-binding Zn ribbon protein